MKRIYLIMVVMTMMSCVSEVEKATVETREVTDVTSSSVRVICNVSDDGGAEVSSRGVCWDTSENPTIETAQSQEAGQGIGNYECDIDGLNSNTTYYVRAYATNSAGVSYGEEIIFNTLSGGGGSGDNMINGYEYVDLGLPSGLKWATCNVGADKPEDYGDYFAWGEISPKTVYDWSTYQHWIDANGDGMCGYGEATINFDISSNAQYDAATANWGGSWRMPTEEEMQELLDNCEWQWTDVNEVLGVRVVGPNGNSIFIPAAGYLQECSLYSAGDFGSYWCSTPFNDSPIGIFLAYSLAFNYGGEDMSYYSSRYYGSTVRPVSE